MIVNLLFPVSKGPPVLTILPVCTTPLTVCWISSPSERVVVDGVLSLTLTLFENPTTGFVFWILPKGNSLL